MPGNRPLLNEPRSVSTNSSALFSKQSHHSSIRSNAQTKTPSALENLQTSCQSMRSPHIMTARL